MKTLTGVKLIAQERERQIKKEGWTKKHDATHNQGELALAAASYALAERGRKMYRPAFLYATISNIWPWDKSWWKPSPKNRVKELVKAGALIAAEIDRLQND